MEAWRPGCPVRPCLWKVVWMSLFLMCFRSYGCIFLYHEYLVRFHNPFIHGFGTAFRSSQKGLTNTIRGSIISFGAFQTYYVTHLQSTPSEISWIGSIAVFLLFSGGVVTGRLTDAGYFHHCTIIGAFLVVFGTFMASLSTKYWQVLLAQAVCTGIGNGCLLTPMMVVVSTYFKKKLPLVLGIAACGSVTGGLIFPSMVRTLLPTIGFGWTMRAVGFIQLGTLTIAVTSARTRLAPKRSGPLLDWTAFGEIEFDVYALGCFLVRIPSRRGAVSDVG